MSLAVIDAALALLMRYSRQEAASKASGGFIISPAVVCAEALKLLLSACLALWSVPISELYQTVVNRGSLKMAVPAILYAVQNNLQVSSRKW